ncbi:hypothetical protein [Peribacillus simplex]|uniref:lipopolysaccharide biosynthesis protein n=1 Tax=Peribacillus simplex TaxID=1478 RepID=UPI003D2E4355
MVKSNRINLITNLISMLLSLLINFIVTPIITNSLGVGVYSYVSIITNIISFFIVLTYTLNSMIGRFYSISYNKGQVINSNKYISSALYTCLLFSIILMPIIILVTVNLDKIIVIEKHLVDDVKMAFFLTGISFLLGTVSAVASTGAYAKNRLELSNYINIFSNVIRLILVILLFQIFTPKIWYIGITTIVYNSLTIVLGFFVFKKLIPKVQFSYKYFDKNYSKELLVAGMFNSVILLGTNLMTQIDLLVGNRYINSELLGKYAIVLLFANTIRSLSSALSSAFSPTTFKIYGTGNREEMVKHSNSVVNFCGLALGLPISIISVVGIDLLSLWLKEDFSRFYLLIILMMLPLVPILSVSQLNVVNQAVNKLKVPALMSIISGILNLLLAIFLAQKIGVWGLAIASVIASTFRNVVFMPIYTAYITKQKLYAYYGGILKPFLISSIICIFGLVIKTLITVNTFKGIIVLSILLTFMYIVLLFGIASRENKIMVINFIRKKFIIR